jgi:hypothetical protein
MIDRDDVEPARRPAGPEQRPRPPARRGGRAAAVGALLAMAAACGAGAASAGASPSGDAAAVRATYAAMNQLWNGVGPAAYCSGDRACLRLAATRIEGLAEDLVRPLVRALRTASTPCIVSTASGVLEMARLARTGARKTLKGSRDASWLSAVTDAMYTVQMGANSCAVWGGGL